MASSASAGPHLGAAAGREVVFCHACQHEWYHDEHESITCPSCQSSFTEIVSAVLSVPPSLAHMFCQVDSTNDPRETQGGFDFSTFHRASSPFLRRPAGSDSDPDEGDIEDHLHTGAPSASGPSNPDARGRANPMETDALRRFAEILNDLGGPARAPRGAPGASGLFPPDERVPQPGTRFQRTTFQTGGPFGSVTFTSGTMGSGTEVPPLTMGTYVIPLTRGDTHPSGPQSRAIAIVHHRATNSGEPLRLLDQLFGNPWGQAGGPNDPGARRDRGAQPPFGGGLAELLSSIYNPTSGVHGDAVFSQEALDRIVTQLMEASPQTNAAPPASQTAIENLEKKQVDDEMLGPEGKAECTICIDELKKGDEVVVLPCKHWYHGECVTLWLKEHNTCPVCRMPIENRPAEAGANNNNNPDNTRQASSPIPGSPSPSAPAYTTSTYPLGPFTFTSLTARPRPERPTARSARENAERLNAIRNLASGSPLSPHRRNSHSPTGLPTPSDEESAARAARVRSDSRERDRGAATGAGWEWAEYTRMAADGTARRVPPRGDGWDWAEFSPLGGRRGSGRDLGRDQSQQQPQQQQPQYQQQQQQNQNQQSQNQQQQGQGQGGNGGGSGGGGGGAFSWIRDHFGRRSQ